MNTEVEIKKDNKKEDEEKKHRSAIKQALEEMPVIEDEKLADVLQPYQNMLELLADYAIDQVNRLDKAIQKTDELAARNRRKMNILQSTLEAYINKQYAEIRVLPKGADPNVQSEGGFKGGWEDYSGQFCIDDEERQEIIIRKAKEHLKRYFVNAEFHRDKRLGIFISSARSGKKTLIKEINTKS